MNIPTFIHVQFVQKDGYLTPDMQLFMDQLIQGLQNSLSNNGWTFPQVTAAQLTKIESLTGDREMPNGTTWYVTDASPPGLVTKENGVLKRIDTSAYP